MTGDGLLDDALAAYRQACESNVVYTIEARDVRPDGTVLNSWCFHANFPQPREVAPYDPPWTRQVRVLPDGPWEDVGGRHEGGAWWREGVGPGTLCLPSEQKRSE